MIRPRANEITARRALVGATVLLLLISLPPRFTRWAAGFGQVTRLLIAPVSHPIDAVAGWLSVRAGEPPEPELVRQLEAELDRYERCTGRRSPAPSGSGGWWRTCRRDPSMRLVSATVIERAEPELAADLVDNGIVLAGGGSMLRGLDIVLQKATGLECRIAEDPLTCVARGTAIYLEHIEEWKATLENDQDSL